MLYLTSYCKFIVVEERDITSEWTPLLLRILMSRVQFFVLKPACICPSEFVINRNPPAIPRYVICTDEKVSLSNLTTRKVALISKTMSLAWFPAPPFVIPSLEKVQTVLPVKAWHIFRQRRRKTYASHSSTVYSQSSLYEDSHHEISLIQTLLLTRHPNADSLIRYLLKKIEDVLTKMQRNYVFGDPISQILSNTAFWLKDLFFYSRPNLVEFLIRCDGVSPIFFYL